MRRIQETPVEQDTEFNDAVTSIVERVLSRPASQAPEIAPLSDAAKQELKQRICASALNHIAQACLENSELTSASPASKDASSSSAQVFEDPARTLSRTIEERNDPREKLALERLIAKVGELLNFAEGGGIRRDHSAVTLDILLEAMSTDPLFNWAGGVRPIVERKVRNRAHVKGMGDALHHSGLIGNAQAYQAISGAVDSLRRKRGE